MKLIIGSQIWDPMVKAAEIALTLERNGRVVIDLNGEAPVMEDTMLVPLFEYLQSQNLDVGKITVLTGNPLETCDTVDVKFVQESFYEFKMFQRYHESVPTHKNIKYHFGNFISRTTMPRLVIASHLYTNYKDKTFQTFHYDHSHEYHKSHVELDQLLNEYGANSVEFDEAVNLLKAAPILQTTAKSYPILHVEKSTMIEPCNWYPDLFVDVICETWPNESGFYVTEKFWRAVATKTPFIIYGPRYVLSNLKKMGFRTFNRYWNEGFQEDFPRDRIDGIKQALKQIGENSIADLMEIYCDMQPILNHNYEIFMNFTHDDLQKLKSQ